MFRTKHREEIVAGTLRQVTIAQMPKRSDDEGHLANVLPADPAHHQVNPDLHPHAPVESGIDEVARVLRDFQAIQHGILGGRHRVSSVSGGAPASRGLRPSPMKEHPLIGLADRQDVTHDGPLGRRKPSPLVNRARSRGARDRRTQTLGAAGSGAVRGADAGERPNPSCNL